MKNQDCDYMDEQNCKLLREIHLAVCGDSSLGVQGLVSEMKHTKARIQTLETMREQGFGAWKILGIISGVVIGTSSVTTCIVLFVQAIHH